MSSSTAAKNITVLFAGGGTGGHLFPAIAIAEELKRIVPAARIVFIGTKKKIEARVVPGKGYEFHTIWISGLHRRLTLDNVLFPLKAVVALRQSYRLLRNVKPDVVVGTGGYVCGPILFAASLLRIPTVIHESNSYPGATTRLLARRVTSVLTTFEVTKRWLPEGAAAEVVGTPTRDELSTVGHDEAIESYGFDPARKTLLVFGGSLGAASINNALAKCITILTAKGFQILWQTGKYPGAEAFQAFNTDRVRVMEFIDAMSVAYAAADCVVCRSGATTLAELTRLGKPAILVPYPRAAANHQDLNARALVDAGAAMLLPDADAAELLSTKVSELLENDDERRAMSTRSRALGKPDAGKNIAQRILALAQS
jgi:UDP-N-acetylglucosamine--N-acetylmuramyl-(pentapeptide) pyrophosphoryl-undecaprenol N-acetylglucosamine transferase